MFNDVVVISDGFTTILPNVLYLLVKLFCAFGYLIVIDKIFAFLFLVGGCAVFLCMQLFRKTLKRLHKQVQETEGKTRSFIQEAVTSLLVVKAFAVEEKSQMMPINTKPITIRQKCAADFSELQLTQA